MIYFWIYLIGFLVFLIVGAASAEYHEFEILPLVMLDINDWNELTFACLIWPLTLVTLILIIPLIILISELPGLLTAPGRAIAKLIKENKNETNE